MVRSIFNLSSFSDLSSIEGTQNCSWSEDFDPDGYLPCDEIPEVFAVPEHDLIPTDIIFRAGRHAN